MKKFSVTDFGAIPNKKEIQTLAFQTAIDKAFLEGGGEVIVPSGEYTIGSIRLRSNVTLHLLSDAKIFGSRNLDDYDIMKNDALEPIPEEEIYDGGWVPSKIGEKRDYSFLKCVTRWTRAIIKIAYANNVAIIGESGSVIDGCDPYDEFGEEFYRGPHGISIHYSSNLTFKGYTIQNTGNWAHNIWYCSNMRFNNIVVKAGHDGIHFGGCQNTEITDCEFYTGDDCVAGMGNLNVLVKNCILNTACSGFRFGGTNVYAEKCKFYGPARYFFRGSLSLEDKKSGAMPTVGRKNMLSVFTYFADVSTKIDYTPGNIQMVDCVAYNVDRFLHYNFSGNERWQMARPLKSIRFENIKAENISMPLTAYGSEELPLSLEFKNVEISLSKKIPFVQGAYFERVTFDNVKIDGEVTSLVKSWTEGGEFIIKNVSGVNTDTPVIIAKEKFVCEPI